jgi:tetratricopeptide (TPR) repeat protein
MLPIGQQFAGTLAPREEADETGSNAMPTAQEQYDDAMFDYSREEFDSAIGKLRAILTEDAAHFDAQLSLAMCFYRKGDYASAITEGHKAQKLQPNEQLVHTNLSLFYMKAGDKKTAEHHGLQARVASWRGNMAPPGTKPAGDSELEMAKPKTPPRKMPEKFPDMPWKKKPPAGGDGSGSAPAH